MAILLTCRHCGADTDSTQSRQGLCNLCTAREILAEDLKELRRLMRKRLRYARRGLRSNDDAIVRHVAIARRRLLRTLLPQPAEEALRALEQEMAAELEREVAGAKRIQLARPGEAIALARLQDGDLIKTLGIAGEGDR